MENEGTHDGLSRNLPAPPQGIDAASSKPTLKEQKVEWEIERKEELQNMEAYRTRSTGDKAQIFQILGFFIVFQGVVINTVCTSTKLTCGTSFFLFALSALVSIATAISVLYKFNDYMEHNKSLLNSQRIFETIKARIANPKDDVYGSSCKQFVENSQVKIQKDERTRRKFKWAVMFFLLLFSIIILISSVVIRCTDG